MERLVNQEPLSNKEAVGDLVDSYGWELFIHDSLQALRARRSALLSNYLISDEERNANIGRMVGALAMLSAPYRFLNREIPKVIVDFFN